MLVCPFNVDGRVGFGKNRTGVLVTHPYFFADHFIDIQYMEPGEAIRLQLFFQKIVLSVRVNEI